LSSFFLARRAVGVAALLAFAACSDSHEPKPPCPRVQPAFRLELTAPGGIPKGTRMDVQYNGTWKESFVVGGSRTGSVDVCCRLGSAVAAGPLPEIKCGEPATSEAGSSEAGSSEAGSSEAGSSEAGSSEAGIPDAGGEEALLCQLWTDGDAEVRVTAFGYPELTEVLEATVDERCGVVTTDVRLSLSLDGGK